MARSKTEERLRAALDERGLAHRQGEYIGRYEVDFLLGEAIVVEVDGYHHLSRSGRRRDARKTAYLRSLGYDVHRIPARRVWIKDKLRAFIGQLERCLQGEANVVQDPQSSLSEAQKRDLKKMQKALVEEPGETAEPCEVPEEDPENDPHRLMRRYLDRHFPRGKT